MVATYMYMRLCGYPAERITILATYNGQKMLLRDVLNERCGRHPLFGLPARVTTVDKYQGQQNDYVLLSLVGPPRASLKRALDRSVDPLRAALRSRRAVVAVALAVCRRSSSSSSCDSSDRLTCFCLLVVPLGLPPSLPLLVSPCFA